MGQLFSINEGSGGNGSGSVTSVSGANGLTGTVTSAGNINLAPIGNNTFLSNIAGSTATPVQNTLTAYLDSTIGTSGGNLIGRDPSGWTVIIAGTSGQVLESRGVSALPTWITPSAGGGGGVGMSYILAVGVCNMTGQISSGSYKNFVFTTTPFIDTANAYNASLGWYAFPHAGNYLVSAFLSANFSTSNGEIQLRFQTGTSTWGLYVACPAPSTTGTAYLGQVAGQCIVQSAGGDTLAPLFEVPFGTMTSFANFVCHMNIVSLF